MELKSGKGGIARSEDRIHIFMQNPGFRSNAKQSLLASAPIISRERELEHDFSYFSLNTPIAPCPTCGDTRINLLHQPAGSVHYASRRCATCDVHRGWEPRPQNREKQSQRQERIARLLRSGKLTDWESIFLESIDGAKKLSPKQEACLERIENKLGGLK